MHHKITAVSRYMVLFLLLGFSCENHAPLQPDATGRLQVKVSWETGLSKNQTAQSASAISRLKVTVSNANGTPVASTELAHNGNSWQGSVELAPASNLTVLCEAFENSKLVYRGAASGVAIEAGKTATVNITMSSVELPAPTPLQPQNGVSLNTNILTFTWSSVGAAAGYHLQIDDTNNFSSPVIADSTLLLTNFTPAAPLADGSYFWRVRGKDAAGNWGAWSSVWDVTIDTQPPSAPALASPANGSTTNDNTPAFDWSAVSGAAAYQLQVDNQSTFASPEIDLSALTASGYTPGSALADGTYFWRARAKDAAGNWGAWSSVWNFTIAPPLSAPTLFSPANGSTTNDNTPAFDWSNVSGAAAYQLQVDNQSNFASPEIDESALNASSYAPGSALADGSYFWRARAKDAVGNWGNWSSVRGFTIDTQPPSAPVLLSPTNGSTTNDNTPAFDWSTVSGAAAYQLQVDNQSTFASPEIDQSALTASGYTPGSALANGTYFWRARAKDTAGNWGAWSSVWSFTITPNNTLLQMISVQGGTFTMGNTWGWVGGFSDERPTHQVTLSSFSMSKYEITQAQYSAVMGTNPSGFFGANKPVEQVSWYDAVAFCNALSQREGFTPAYSINGNNVSWNAAANGYRLPTEAEWEYAARGGNQSQRYKYSGSNNPDAVAWYSDNSGSKTHDVGTKQGNELGIYDMSGNVWEWCWDWYSASYYSNSPPNNPKGPSSGIYRVLRGGSWYSNTGDVRSANRDRLNAVVTNFNIGFRCVRNVL